jgi:ferric-dicitrate binding protein FerR (iron transport regulator)
VAADDKSPETCNRVPEALAAGMVWGDAALLEHAKSCEICATQLVVLKKRREFRDAFPVLSSIADEAPRVDATTGDARARAARRRHVLLMITAVIAIVLFIVRSRAFYAPPAPMEGDASGTLGPPRFRIFNLANALFESKVEGATVHASMTRGVAVFQVDRLTPNQRFLLALPDGDLEVRGTRFVVTVEAGKTQGVDVNDGKVALRLHGHDEIVLSAGERWPAGSTRPSVSFIDFGPSTKDAGATEPKSNP